MESSKTLKTDEFALDDKLTNLFSFYFSHRRSLEGLFWMLRCGTEKLQIDKEAPYP